ncbi:hypothetical protein ACFSSA_04370 [Luteolibacter algae]|uniref:Uncharacterized protein n=1 Tax=Luteolibacter algae TaxID=454151 RepID=A0ABW5D592_9BACT
MDKNTVVESIRDVAKKMGMHSVRSGHIKSLEEDWPRDDLREMANLLEQCDWSDLGQDELATLGYLWNRYAGKGEQFAGYISHGILTKEEVHHFSQAIDFASAKIRAKLGIQKYS